MSALIRPIHDQKSLLNMMRIGS